MIEAAYKTFQEMQQDDVKPDMKTYSALIIGFSQIGDVEKVNQLQEVTLHRTCVFVTPILSIFFFCTIRKWQL